MKPEIPLKNGVERDAFSNWRKVLCYMGRPGMVKWAQRCYHKRTRRQAKREVAQLNTKDNRTK